MFGLSTIKLYAIGAVALVAVSYVGWREISIRNLRADLVDARSQVASYERSVKTLLSDSDHNKSVIASLSNELNRVKNEAKSVKIIKEKVAQDALVCKGVPPAGRTAARWLHDNR